MVKVANPLGGPEAHGRIGQSIIFQGTTAKAYAEPVIKKVQGQLDAQDRFQSVTKMIRELKAWGRGALQAMLGVRWYPLIYREICNYWGDAETIFNAFSEGNKTDWRQQAPYQFTKLDCGLVFFACAYAINEVSILHSYEFFGNQQPTGNNANVANGLWGQSLDGVFLSGVHDDSNDYMYWIGEGFDWIRNNDANAFNGSYMLSHASNPASVDFFVYGSRFGILYHQATMQGVASVAIDTVTNWEFSQNDAAGLWQVEWSSPAFNRGLHRVNVTRTGAEGPINIDGIVVYA